MNNAKTPIKQLADKRKKKQNNDDNFLALSTRRNIKEF